MLLVTNTIMIYPALSKTIEGLSQYHVSEARKRLLQPLVDFIQQKVNLRQRINLHFICTHNSRRSHFSQVWAQVAAAHFGIPEVYCYSGGTTETALFPKVAETLTDQGFQVFHLSAGSNPVYAVKYAADAMPVIGFSKPYDSPFNPASAFAAVMTCSQADDGCPFIAGVETRISLPFEDPKRADHTPEQARVYAASSLQIAAEMYALFSTIKK